MTGFLTEIRVARTIGSTMKLEIKKIIAGIKSTLLSTTISEDIFPDVNLALNRIAESSSLPGLQAELIELLYQFTTAYLNTNQPILLQWLEHPLWKEMFKLEKINKTNQKPNTYQLAMSHSALFNFSVTHYALGHHAHLKQMRDKNNERIVYSDCPAKIDYEAIQKLANNLEQQEIFINETSENEIVSILQEVHTAEYINQVKKLSELSEQLGIRLPLDQWGDTFISPDSYKAALHAAVITANIVNQAYQHNQSGLCVVRPPGHHAGTDFGEGFCIFNNVAVSIKKLINQGANNLLILDIDAHHGNGTLNILSRHQNWAEKVTLYDFYDGKNYHGLNGVWPVDQANSVTRQMFDMSINHRDSTTILNQLSNILQHDFDFIVVSFGLDGHRNDPLGGGLGYDDQFYLTVIKQLQEKKPGKFALVLEGGYNTDTITRIINLGMPLINNENSTENPRRLA